jgi:hypothetical protein
VRRPLGRSGRPPDAHPETVGEVQAQLEVELEALVLAGGERHAREERGQHGLGLRDRQLGDERGTSAGAERQVGARPHARGVVEEPPRREPDQVGELVRAALDRVDVHRHPGSGAEAVPSRNGGQSA